MNRRTSRYHPARRATCATALTTPLTAAVLASVLLVGTVSADDVSAAPNPYMGESAAHTVTIASDGSYRVHIDQTMELARDFQFTFGGIVHDGFRLPDTEAELPPYLRAQYSDPAITMDGQAAEVEIEREVHAVEIAAKDEFSEGEHTGTVDYRVTGAAVSPEYAVGPELADIDEDRMTVYLRPIVSGDVIVKAGDPILGVSCEGWLPGGEPCGSRSGKVWTIGEDEQGDPSVIRITLDADEAEIIEPKIDTKK